MIPSGPIKACLIDLDGVIYTGAGAIPGAVEMVQTLQDHDLPFMFVTNTTSRPCSALVEKLAGFGLSVSPKRIWTPPMAAAAWLRAHAAGPTAFFLPQATQAEFTDIVRFDPRQHARATAVVVGDLLDEWTYARLNAAFQHLMQDPRPQLLALGMTRYWRAEDGFRLDVGSFVKALEYAAGCEALVLGKPAPAFFETALDLLNVKADQALMIGDDIRVDVKGAQAAGMAAALVRTGKFTPRDLQEEIKPQWVLESIADLGLILGWEDTP